jgi:hypothetical protein
MEEQLGHIIQAWMLPKTTRKGKKRIGVSSGIRMFFAAFSTNTFNATSKNELTYL